MSFLNVVMAYIWPIMAFYVPIEKLDQWQTPTSLIRHVFANILQKSEICVFVDVGYGQENQLQPKNIIDFLVKDIKLKIDILECDINKTGIQVCCVFVIPVIWDFKLVHCEIK